MNIEKKEEKLEELTSLFSDSVSWDTTWRDEAKIDYQYYNGVQWTSEDIEVLQERNQAVTTYNHIAPAIDAIIGGERQNRPDITMAGRTLDDERIAQVKSELYSYIQYNTKSDDELDAAIKDFLVVGRGFLYVYPALKADGTIDDVMHQYVDYRDMFTDPLSRKDDFSDATYVHYAIYTDSNRIKEQFPAFIEDDADSDVYGFESSSEEDIWFSEQNRKRPRLITTWQRHPNGDMELSVWVKGQLLYNRTNLYSNKDFPYTMITYKRNLDNMPYGLVRSMRSAQDEVNKRHSKALHYLNARQVLAEEDAFVSWDDAEKTLAKPDGITKLRDGALTEGRMQIVDNVALASTHIEMMNIAKSQITEVAGINAAFVGQAGQNYDSAKKTMVNIAQAQNVLVPMLNKIRQARYRLAEFTMKLVPDYYTDERIIRIIEPSGTYAFMPVNKVVLLDDGTLQKLNDLSVDDVDVIIEDAPSGLNDRAEQFAQLLQIQGQTSRPIPMEILLRYSQLKDKYQLAEELKQYYSMEAQLQQAQQAMEQMQAQIEKMGGQVNQVTSQLIQANVARAVDKEVGKAKEEISKDKQAIKQANKE